jgi:hypothetical protein
MYTNCIGSYLDQCIGYHKSVALVLFVHFQCISRQHLQLGYYRLSATISSLYHNYHPLI